MNMCTKLIDRHWSRPSNHKLIPLLIRSLTTRVRSKNIYNIGIFARHFARRKWQNTILFGSTDFTTRAGCSSSPPAQFSLNTPQCRQAEAIALPTFTQTFPSLMSDSPQVRWKVAGHSGYQHRCRMFPTEWSQPLHLAEEEVLRFESSGHPSPPHTFEPFSPGRC